MASFKIDGSSAGKVRISGGSGVVRISPAEQLMSSPVPVKLSVSSPGVVKLDLGKKTFLSDISGTISLDTITVADSSSSGVAVAGLTAEMVKLLTNNSQSSGTVWQATWSEGSKFLTTPVVAFPGFSDRGVAFWLVNPEDADLSSGVAGSFKFPVHLKPLDSVADPTWQIKMDSWRILRGR